MPTGKPDQRRPGKQQDPLPGVQELGGARMSRIQKILEEIEKHKHIVEIFGREVYFVPLEAVKQVIRKHMDDDWIPVEERTPEEDGFYLCTMDGKIVGEEEPFTGLSEFEKRFVD